MKKSAGKMDGEMTRDCYRCVRRRSLGAFQMRQASTQMGYWSRWKVARSGSRHFGPVEITKSLY